jgi:AcrR family transcriptional regulator
MTSNGSRDRRVWRTRGLLHEALATLIHEKAYDDIAVKEILARAGVGRSTFYVHFSDKDDLLQSSIREVLRAGETLQATSLAGLSERVLQFSLPLLEHIERHWAGDRPPVSPQGQAVVHDRLERLLAERIAGDLEQASRPHGESGRSVPYDLLARHVASTFVVVLNWWLGSEEPLPARKVNELFRSLVRPGLASAGCAAGGG